MNNADNDIASKNSSFLKNLSMSEILTLAKDRARVAGIGRRSSDHSSIHKRMAVSDNITRSQAMRTNVTNNKQIGLSNIVDDGLKDNDLFFENLTKKMVAEQFMPGDKLRKRMCLWNKENSGTFKTTKHHNHSKITNNSIPTTMGLFSRRLLPEKDHKSPVQKNFLLQCEAMKTGVQGIPQQKSTVNRLLENMDITQGNFYHSGNCSSSSAATDSIIASSLGTRTSSVDNLFLSRTQEIMKLPHNHSIKPVQNLSKYEGIQCGCYAEKCSEKSWDIPSFSSVKEYYEPFILADCESSILIPILNMEPDDTSLQLTPPPSETDDCKACSSDHVDYDNSVDDSNQSSSLLMLDRPDDEFFVIQDNNLII